MYYISPFVSLYLFTFFSGSFSFSALVFSSLIILSFKFLFPHYYNQENYDLLSSSRSYSCKTNFLSPLFYSISSSFSTFLFPSSKLTLSVLLPFLFFSLSFIKSTCPNILFYLFCLKFQLPYRILHLFFLRRLSLPLFTSIFCWGITKNTTFFSIATTCLLF